MKLRTSAVRIVDGIELLIPVLRKGGVPYLTSRQWALLLELTGFSNDKKEDLPVVERILRNMKFNTLSVNFKTRYLMPERGE